MKLVLPPSHCSVQNQSHKARFMPMLKATMRPGKICCRTTLVPWFARVQTWDATVDLRLAWMKLFNAAKKEAKLTQKAEDS